MLRHFLPVRFFRRFTDFTLILSASFSAAFQSDSLQAVFSPFLRFPY